MIGNRTAHRRLIAAVSVACALIAAPLHAEPSSVGAGSAEKNQPSSFEGKAARQRPGDQPRPTEFPEFIYESIPDINSSASDFVPVPDRWRQFYQGKWYDPYNQNVLKADVPIFGSQAHPWFVDISLISESGYENRYLPIPIGVGGASTKNPQSTDLFGDGHQFVFSETFITSFALIQGNTTFRPQDFEFRITPVFNYNYANFEETAVLRADPSRGSSRSDDFEGVLEAFADIHLANLTDRYDFVSTRLGVQPFVSDFRGFVFNDSEPGARLFGNYDNNKWQGNLAYFRRVDKDTNSGLNTWFEDRYEDILVANLYRQDAPVLGHTLQASVIHREDSAGDHRSIYDSNGFLVRPVSIGDERDKNLSTTYFGLNGDGHLDRINSTASLYYVTGSESHNPIAGRQIDISAGMAALELSYDMNWIRWRASSFWASGDGDPFDSKGNGFDSIFDNPNFAGGDNSYWQRQGIPFIGGGGTNLKNGRSLLPDLRPGKEKGQSNFVNPGLRLYNLGVDFEVTPKFRIINNASYLQFDDTSTLETLRQDGSISNSIGFDLSSGILYRPFLSNNVQIRAGGAVLIPDEALNNLFGSESLYQFFTSLTLQY